MHGAPSLASCQPTYYYSKSSTLLQVCPCILHFEPWRVRLAAKLKQLRIAFGCLLPVAGELGRARGAVCRVEPLWRSPQNGFELRKCQRGLIQFEVQLTQ